MTKVVELRETLENSSFLPNIHNINQVTALIIRTIQMNAIDDINIDDFNYFNAVAEKSKIALQKVYSLI